MQLWNNPLLRSTVCWRSGNIVHDLLSPHLEMRNLTLHNIIDYLSGLDKPTF